MASSTERLLVYGTSEELPRTILGCASISHDRAFQRVLRIDLRAFPRDGQVEIPIRDVLILADQAGGGS